MGRPALDPDLAEVALVDRFSPEAGTLAVRSEGNELPDAGEAIDFDRRPFLVQGFGPSGERIRYYDLDIKSQVPADLYLMERGGASIEGQLPILSHVPGEPGYNDFWRVHTVQVPEGYVANSIASTDDVRASGFLVTPTARIVHRAVVPPGSTARLRFGGADASLGRGWHAGTVASFFSFEDSVPAVPSAFGGLAVGIAYIWATFNIDADQVDGGPPSGAMLEGAGLQTHNVAEALPGDPDYSPLWMVISYDNTSFEGVLDRDSAERAPVVAGVGSPLVNCPIVAVDP